MSTTMQRLSMAAVLGTFAALTTSAVAQVTVFTDRAAFEAAAGAVMVEDFNSLTPQPLTAGVPLDTGLITIQWDSTGSGDAAIAAGSAFGNIDGTNFYDGWSNVPDVFTTVTFDSAITAYGADYVSSTSGDQLTIIVNGMEILFTDHLPSPGTGFLGIISTTPFTSIEYGDEMVTGAELWSMDNVTIGGGMPLPTATATATATSTATPIPTATAIPTATMLGAPTSTPLPGAPTATPDPSDPIATATPDGGNGGGGSGSACPCGVGSTVPVALLTLGFIALRRRR